MLAFLATTSCYSFAITRHQVELTCSKASTPLYVWVSDQTFPENLAEHSWPVQILLVTLNQPFNMFFGLLAGVRAPLDADYDIRLGPVGFLAGVTVPGLTVMPALMRGPEPSLQVDDDIYRKLLDAIDAGEGIAAFRDSGAQEAISGTVLDVARAPEPSPLPKR